MGKPSGRIVEDHRRPRTAVMLGAVALALIMAAVLGVWFVRSDADSTATGEAAPPTPQQQEGTGISGTSDGDTGTSTEAGQVQDLTSQVRVTASQVAPNGVDDAGGTTTYEPSNVLDGDPATAWRMVGDGTGALLQFSFPASTTLTEVGLVNGYAKVDPSSGADRYAEERRIIRVVWVSDTGDSVVQDVVDGDRSMQTIQIPGLRATVLTLRIDGTTSPGDPERDYTPISDVVLVGSPS